MRFYNIDYKEKHLEREMADFQNDNFDGVKVAISVNMLKNMEIDSLKLNLRACGNLEFGSMAAIFDQARKLNVEMSAEGVENASQVTDLKKCGCEVAQGYFFHKPMSIEAFEDLSDQG